MPDLTKIDIGVHLNVENKEEVIAEIAQGFQDATRAGNPMPGTTGYTIGGTTGVPAQATPLNNAMAGTTSGMSPLNVATGILLADVIKEMVDNSKILSTVFGTVAQLLGLLVDLILLPFMPTLVIGIMALVSGIMLFNEFWQSVNWKVILGGAGSANNNAPIQGSTLATAVNVGQSAADIAAALFGGILGAIVGGPWGAAIGAAIMTLFVNTAYNAMYNAGYEFMGLIRNTIIPSLEILGNNLKNWAEGAGNWISSGLNSIKDTIVNFFTGLPGVLTSFISGAAQNVGKALVSALPWPFNTIASLGIQAGQNTQNQQGGSPPASNNVFNISGDIIDAENWFTSMMNKVGLPLGL